MRHDCQRSIIVTIRQEELLTAGKTVLHVRIIRTVDNCFSVQSVPEPGTHCEPYHQEEH